jgi:hypothetical protein
LSLEREGLLLSFVELLEPRETALLVDLTENTPKIVANVATKSAKHENDVVGCSS